VPPLLVGFCRLRTQSNSLIPYKSHIPSGKFTVGPLKLPGLIGNESSNPELSARVFHYVDFPSPSGPVNHGVGGQFLLGVTHFGGEET